MAFLNIIRAFPGGNKGGPSFVSAFHLLQRNIRNALIETPFERSIQWPVITPFQLTIFMFYSIVTYFSEINKLQFLVQYFLCINHNIIAVLLCIAHNISFKTPIPFSTFKYRFINLPVMLKYFSDSCLCTFSHTSLYCDRAYIVIYIYGHLHNL